MSIFWIVTSMHVHVCGMCAHVYTHACVNVWECMLCAHTCEHVCMCLCVCTHSWNTIEEVCVLEELNVCQVGPGLPFTPFCPNTSPWKACQVSPAELKIWQCLCNWGHAPFLYQTLYMTQYLATEQRLHCPLCLWFCPQSYCDSVGHIQPSSVHVELGAWAQQMSEQTGSTRAEIPGTETSSAWRWLNF